MKKLYKSLLLLILTTAADAQQPASYRLIAFSDYSVGYGATQTKVLADSGSYKYSNGRGSLPDPMTFSVVQDALLKTDTSYELLYGINSALPPIGRRISQYDAHDNVLAYQLESYDTGSGIWTATQSVNYIYDQMGNVSSMVQLKQNGNGLGNFQTEFYQYDIHNTLLLDSVNRWINGTWVQAGITHNTTDPNGNIIVSDYRITSTQPYERYNYTYGNGNQRLTAVHYVYQQNGSWWQQAKDSFVYNAAGLQVDYYRSLWDTSGNCWFFDQRQTDSFVNNDDVLLKSYSYEKISQTWIDSKAISTVYDNHHKPLQRRWFNWAASMHRFQFDQGYGVIYNASQLPVTRTIYQDSAFAIPKEQSHFYYETYTPTGVASSTLEMPELMLYPSPAHSFLQMKLTAAESQDFIIRIYNISGRLMEQWTEKATGTVSNRTISLSRYAPGVYTLLITGKNGKQAKLFVVE